MLKFVLNKKFLTQIASVLLRQIEQVLRLIGIIYLQQKELIIIRYYIAMEHHSLELKTKLQLPTVHIAT